MGVFLPALLIIGFIYFIFRQAQGTNNQAMSFGKSRARIFTGDHPTVTFVDVAGCIEAKEELQEVVHFLKQPEKYINFGARIPRGLLMVGPPARCRDSSPARRSTVECQCYADVSIRTYGNRNTRFQQGCGRRNLQV